MKTINLQSLRQITTALSTGQFSSVELTHYYLQRIADYKWMNAYISVDEDYALKQAQEADKKIKKGEASIFTGVPIAHKDIFCTKHFTTTCASKMLANYHSPFQATIVENLEKTGVVVLGKTNMDEFAMGSGNESSYFGSVANPWDKTRVPGGSSGGSAAVVSAHLAAFATGSDTGGSIRQPAAFCGISGIKPTYGLASRWGMIAFASSLDQAGPMARSAEDLALILPQMIGFDSKDSTSLDKAVPDYLANLNHSVKGLKIGLPSCFFSSNINASIRNTIRDAVTCLEQAGAIIIPIELSLQPLWVPCYYIIACAEASSNLSRYDGVRFGHRSSKTNSIKELITYSRTEGFGEEVKRRILTGTYVLSAGYVEAYYRKALKIRRLIQNELIQAFQEVDIILGPTTPSPAFQANTKHLNPAENYLSDVFTVAANLAGLPAMSIPAGFIDNLPVGMQLIGSHFSEGILLNVAHQYQQMTNWHLKTPQGV